jgi:hypothetical protein
MYLSLSPLKKDYLMKRRTLLQINDFGQKVLEYL